MICVQTKNSKFKMKTIIISIVIGLSITGFKEEVQEPTGKEIFEKNCAKCHGKDGTKRLLSTR